MLGCTTIVAFDLDYPEDRDATVDANIVMTGSGQFVEVQSSGEEATFSRTQLNELLALAEKGVYELVDLQKAQLLRGNPSGQESFIPWLAIR